MTTIEYLERIRKLDAIIANKKREYQRWVSAASDIGGGLAAERVQTSKSLHKGENAIIEYISIEQEIERLTEEREGIIATLQKLPTNEYRILYDIYVDGLMLKELPSKYRRSYEWVKNKKRKALQHLQTILGT